MDDAAGVGGGERSGHLRGDPRRLARRQRSRPAQDRGEVLAVDQLHHDERTAGILAVVVHADHVRMVELGDVLGLLAEAREEVRIAAVLRPEQLDGDVAIQLGVMRPEDGRHATLTEKLDQAVAPAEHGSDVGQAVFLLPHPASRWTRPES